MRSRFLIRAIVLGALISPLVACTNLWQAGWQTVQQTQASKIDPQQLGLDPNLRYLKVAINQHEVLMVEAYRAGSESVWVSSDLAILKTRNGYLSDLEGFRINWQDVRGLNLVTAAQLAKPTAYTRMRNEMPGYRYHLRESILVSPLGAPPQDVNLVWSSNSSLRWFSEALSTQADGQIPKYNYPGVFAIDTSQDPYQVVFGRQCLAPDYCIRWQLVEKNEGLVRAKP